jgi:hypothetical protein
MTDASIWDHSDPAHRDIDLVGFGVEATDGHIGKIDEAANEIGRSHVVVDTGHWIFEKKRLIPAGVIERVDESDKKVYLSITKADVKAAPDFEPDDGRPADSSYYIIEGDFWTGFGQ